MIFSIKNYGMLGATIPWVFVNLISFIVIGLYITNKFLVGNAIKWLSFDIFLPVLITIIVGLIVTWLAMFERFPYAFIIESMVIGLMSIFINIIVFNRCNPSNKLFNLIRSGNK